MKAIPAFLFRSGSSEMRERGACGIIMGGRDPRGDGDLPTYYFETVDAADVVSDVTGQELADDDAARRAAIRVLPEMALDALPDGNLHEFKVIARDPSGRIVYQATLTFHGQWGEPASADASRG